MSCRSVRACETRQKPNVSGFDTALPDGRYKLLVTCIHKIFLKLNNPVQGVSLFMVNFEIKETHLLSERSPNRDEPH